MKLVDKECRILFDRLIECGMFEIYFCDCHNRGEYTSYLMDEYKGIHFFKSIWDINFENKFDYAILCGFHAKGISEGVLAHTFRDDIKNIFLGNRSIGEVEFFINLLAYYKIIPVFISGCCETLKEVANVKCIKNCSKYITKANSYDEFYKELNFNIKKLVEILKKDDNYFEKCVYNSDKINVELVRREMYDEFEANTVEYADTLEFYRELYKLCEKLNRYWRKLDDELWELKEWVHDMRIDKSILDEDVVMKKDIKEITLTDIRNIKEKVLSKEKC